jgi:pimeloyl-ACP methyl ester carboxylesterase
MRKIALLFLFFTFFVLPSFAFAEITHPYTVDEKPQVLFGDTAEITVVSTSTSGEVSTTTYKGLENYKQDYVEGFAHFTFTYTHNKCCYASYPPFVYVTDVDSRTTPSPIQKWEYYAYQIPSSYNISTDWYSYDIQFNATGFNVVVKEAGLNEIYNNRFDVPGQVTSDWVSIANLHPIYDNTPSMYSMAFTPVPISNTPPPPTIDPVIIIPGITGSATKNGKLVIDPILHTYDDLIATLKANGYEEGKDLFTFPYEWRDSNVLTANLLKDKINEVKQICHCQKVDLVAHSMGGLVAREYIQQSGNYDNDIDQLIFLGTPHKGSQQAYLQWEAGQSDNSFFNNLVNIFFLAEAARNGYQTVFDYIHGRPIDSVEQLLPIFDYIKDKDTGIIRQYPDNYPENNFLYVLDRTLQFLLNSGVRITNIVGDSGENKTINYIRVEPTNSLKYWEYGKPDGFGTMFGDNGLERGTGDNTVTKYSATLDNVTNEEISASHNRIPTLAANRIFNILTNKNSITNIDNNYGTDYKVLILQLLSPIDMVVIAPDGKKMGKNFETGEEYNEISLAFYSGYKNNDNEYITIPNPVDGKYKIEVQGTGNGGKYGVLTSYISDNFATTTQTTGIIKPNQITELDVTINNQNPKNLDTERVITSEILLNDINGSYDLGWIKDSKTRDALIKQVNSAIKFNKKIDIIKERQKDGSIKEKRIERFEIKANKILARLFVIELRTLLKKKTITQDAFDLIKNDVEYLINN